MKRILITVSVLVAIVVAAMVMLVPGGEGETEKDPTPTKTAPTPIPTPKAAALEMRDLLYSELSLDDCCKMLGGDLGEPLKNHLEKKSFADARDLLETEASQTLLSDNPVYWAALARIRDELGDPVGAGDAAQKSHTLAENDSRLEYATIRLLENLAQDAGEEATRVLGVICEIGYDEGLVVVVGFEDGQSHIFFGTGGGLIGDTAQYTHVAAAAQRLVATARPFALRTPVQRDRSLPMRGEVRFVMLTPEGPRVITEQKSELESGSAGTPLYRSMQKLLTPLRTLMKREAVNR